MDETGSIDSSLILILLGVIGMLLLAVSVIVFFIVYQKRSFLQQEEIKDLETAYQKDLLASSIQAQEMERKRVASELHDGLGSVLSAIRLYVLHLSPDKPPQEYEDLLNETKEMVDSAITQTREISHDLLPTILDRFGFIQALDDLCKRLEKLNDMEVRFNYDYELKFTKQQDLALYRIFQELINNTLKHAAATKIQIDLKTVENQVNISYQDNGKGLTEEAAKRLSTGIGLKSIESRANLINAKMNMPIDQGQGFQFNLSLVC